MTSTDLLRTRGVAKSYGPVVALESADLEVAGGEIHALLGANGAGKSTLVRIIAGVTPPGAGTIEVAGRPVRFRSPADARAAGLAPVFQDPSFAPDLTVAENLRLTRTEPDAVRRWLDEFGLRVDLSAFVTELPLPLLRMLDLARALAHEPALLLLDEITAALPTDYTERVFDLLRRWRGEGRSVLFISHRLPEVRQICDRVTVLRDGRDVDTHATTDGGEQRIVAAMLGERAAAQTASSAGREPPRAREVGERMLEVTHLSDGDKLRDVSFTLGAGEVLGVVALEGQGQDTLFAILSGEQRPAAGEIRVHGKRIAPRHPRDALREGLAYVPSDRQQTLLPQRSVLENLSSPLYAAMRRWGWIRADRERTDVNEVVARLSIDIRAQDQARRLSGGNQQKVTVGRWLVAGFSTLLCFDPTRGIDVGTKHQIYNLVRQLADQGKSVLMFTSELREVPLACDRVVVLYDGHVVADLDAADAHETTLLGAAHGLAPAMEA